MRPRLVVAVATGLLPFALMPLGWWLVGDLSESSVRGQSDLMYLLSPPRWSPQVDRLVLGGSLLVAIGLVVVLVAVVRRSRPVVVGLLLVAATLVIGIGWGWFGRVLTIGAHGANMSALVVPLGPVLLAMQAGLAVLAGWLVDPARPGSPAPPAPSAPWPRPSQVTLR